MAGINRQVNGEVAHTKSKGKKFIDELWNRFKPSALAREMPKTQPLKGKKKTS